MARTAAGARGAEANRARGVIRGGDAGAAARKGDAAKPKAVVADISGVRNAARRGVTVDGGSGAVSGTRHAVSSQVSEENNKFPRQNAPRGVGREACP